VAKTWPHSHLPTYLPTRVFSVFCKPQLLLILFRNVLSETFIARNKPVGILRMLTKVGIPFSKMAVVIFKLFFQWCPLSVYHTEIFYFLFLRVTSFIASGWGNSQNNGPSALGAVTSGRAPTFEYCPTLDLAIILRYTEKMVCDV